jgi:hypothetical protein
MLRLNDAVIDTKAIESFTALLDQLCSMRKEDTPLPLRYGVQDDLA